MNNRILSDFITKNPRPDLLVCDPITEGASQKDHERLQELLADYFYHAHNSKDRQKSAELLGNKFAFLVEEFWKNTHDMAVFERDYETEDAA